MENETKNTLVLRKNYIFIWLFVNTGDLSLWFQMKMNHVNGFSESKLIMLMAV